MPTLPDLTIEKRPSPQPAFGVSGYRVQQSGLELLGDEAGKLAVQVRQEQEKIDRLAAEDALTKLREKQLDLTSGEQEGFLNVKGEGAIKPDFYGNYSGKFDQAAKDIGATLTTDQQKLYRQRASMVRLQFNEGVLRHAASEGDRYAVQTNAGIVDVETRVAQKSWINPNAIAVSKERVTSSTNDLADRMGWGKDVRDANIAKDISGINAAVVEQATAAGAYKYAKDYAEANKMGDAVIEKIRKSEEIATFDTKSVDGAKALITLNGGNYDAAIKEAWNIPNGKLAKQTVAVIKEQQTETLQEKNRLDNDMLESGMLNIKKGMKFKALTNSNEYKTGDDGVKGRLLEGWYRWQDYRLAKAQGTTPKETPDQWAHMTKLRELAGKPGGLAESGLVFEEEMLKVPHSQWDNLSALWNTTKKGGSEKNILTLNQHLDAAMPGLGFDKTQEDVFKGYVLRKYLEYGQTHDGKTPDDDEIKKIIDRGLIDGEVLSGSKLHWFINDPNKKYYEVGTDESARFAPKMSADDRKGIIEAYKKDNKGKIPSEEVIMQRYKRGMGLE